MTTPRTSLSLEVVWGSYDRQFGNDLAAYGARQYGGELGDYIFDVGKVSDVARIGCVHDKPMLYAVAVNPTQVAGIASGTYHKTGDNYVL